MMQWFINALCFFIATSGTALAADVEEIKEIIYPDIVANTAHPKAAKKPLPSPRTPKSRQKLKKKSSAVKFNLSPIENSTTSSPNKTRKKYREEQKKSPHVISSSGETFGSITPKILRSTLDETPTNKTSLSKSRSLVLNAMPLGRKTTGNNIDKAITDSRSTLSQSDPSGENESSMAPTSLMQKAVPSPSEQNISNAIPPLAFAPLSPILAAPPSPIFRKNCDNKFDSTSDFWSPDYQSVRSFLTGLDLRQKNDQIVQLLYDAVEACALVEIEAAYQTLLKNGYDVNQIITKHKLSPAEAAQKYGHNDLSIYLKKFQDKFLLKSFKQLSPIDKAKELESLIKNNSTQRTAIIKSSFAKNFDLVKNVFELGTSEQITDLNFSYKIFEELTCSTNDDKILNIQMKIKPEEPGQENIVDQKDILNRQVANINRFKGTYLFKFFNQRSGIHSKQIETERLNRVEKWIYKEQIAKAKEFLDDQELLTASAVINNENAKHEDKLNAAAKLWIAEALFSKDVIAELDSQTELWHGMMVEKAKKMLNDVSQDPPTRLKNAKMIIDASGTYPLTTIVQSLEAGALIDQAYEMLENTDFAIPDIISAGHDITKAKEYLKVNKIALAAKRISDAEEYFSTWDHLWMRFDERMSESFNWHFGHNNFRTELKKIFDRLVQNEKQNIKLREKFDDKSIDSHALWFMMHKGRLLSFVPRENEEKILALECPEKFREQKKYRDDQLVKFNELINMNKDFRLKLKTIALHDLAEQKKLLIFALNHWEFFNKKKLINQLFFPTPHASIGVGIFLDRPLFKDDEEFAELF